MSVTVVPTNDNIHSMLLVLDEIRKKVSNGDIVGIVLVDIDRERNFATSFAGKLSPLEVIGALTCAVSDAADKTRE